MNDFDYYISNLKILYPLNDSTDIAIFEPTGKICVVKRVSISMYDYYLKLKNLNIQGAVKILAVLKSVDFCTVVREYVSGDTLSDILSGSQSIPKEKAVGIILDILKVLSILHSEKLVHRDINPNNIVIDSAGRAVLIDFGILRSYDKSKNSDTVIMGTPGYAAPEQFGFTQSDSRTDIYAVGVLFNVMLCGEMPVKKKAAGKFGEIIEKCTQIDAENRYNSVDEIIEILEMKSGNSVIDKFFSKIPGLHFKITAFSVIAALAYVLSIIVIVYLYATAVDNSAWGIIRRTLYVLLIIIIPYVSFTGVGDIKNRIPITKNATHKSQSIFYTAIGIISMMLGFLLVGLTK